MAELGELSALGQAISEWMRREGLSLNSAAEICKLSAQGLKKNMLCGHRPEHRTLQKIAQGMGLAIEKIEALARGEDLPIQDLVLIRQYNLEASAGPGTFIESEPMAGLIALSRDMVRGTLHAQPDKLSALYVKGDSMEPQLRAGDMVVIDHGQTRERTDGIYVLRIDGSLLIKSLQWLPGGKLRVKSENLAYESYTVDPLQDEVHVIGRVVWVGRKL